jgi:hypothetical protein
VAILTWLSLAYAAILMLALAAVLVTILGLLWKIGTALREVHRTRRRIAAHTAPLDGQIRAVTDGMASAAESLTTAVAAIHRAQATVNKVA